ncbi:hypothetical protein E4U19_000221 [Claviceps sp. Clav32 group G5]|nr:hypothetical protein E4U19_000221 [Claviceps sp. Clav32 group G5]
MLYSIFLRLSFIPSKIYSLVCSWLQRFNLTRPHHVQRPAQRYGGGMNAELLERYEPGDGVPSYATTWATKDQKDDRYVALKIMISQVEESRELKILRAISTLPKHHPGSSYVNQMLPAKLAKLFARQTLQGLDFLAANDIGHGDLHTRNLAIVVPGLDALNEENFIARLGERVTGAVTKLDDGPWAPKFPTYQLR